ncbi:uncharacterized protein ALTATR162_LOCUS5176 [Alternaria atra]|uniref:LYC1 C-terminal domain-containing protein n=1 Tax=Alternaria atra TaxID=119953 RepID=A0A8J2N611_9PLEO|nr:uncharacterized protein ALTATR162_LOCUS5176 [Alternaria atra]CAG5158630.1 unnamed protein product [Alternaria atra]
MIYSNKEAFYARLGWSPIPAPAIVLSTDLSIDNELHTTYGMQKHLSYLRAEDIDELCKEDIRTLVLEIDKARTPGRNTILTVLPTTDLIGWQHTRAEFYGMKIHKKSPTIKGAFHSSNAWIYWHHDFRKQRLFVQRVRILDGLEGEKSDVLSALLLCAVREAQSWGLPMVVVWGVASDLCDAFEILSSKFEGLNPMLQTQRRETTSFRWRGCKSYKTHIIPNEHYSWI